MNSKNPNVKEHFDAYAETGRWQSLYSKNVSAKNFPFIVRLKWYRDVIQILAPKTVLDIGCGSGDFISIIPDSTELYRGVDLSEHMVIATQKIIAQLPEDRRIRFSAEQSDFKSYQGKDHFDFILASGFLEYFDDLQPVVNRLYELTAVGGYLAIQVPNREFFRWNGISLIEEKNKSFKHYRISGDECDALMVEAGYEKIQGDYINHFYYRYTSTFPRLHIFLDRVLRKITPRAISRIRSSMYCGVYKRNDHV
jgi:SAM-dependent methyltransferase